MLAVTIYSLLKRKNVPRKKFSTRTVLGIRSINCTLLNASKIPRPWIGLGRTIRTIDAIKKAVVIMAFVAQDLQPLLELLGLIESILLLKTIVTAIGHQSRRIKTLVKLPITIVTRKDILLISILSLTSQKTSIGLGNLYISDWC